MPSPRTNEYLFILQESFNWQVKIEAVQTNTEWGSTYYEIIVYIPELVIEAINNSKDSKKTMLEFTNDGGVAVMDKDGVAVGETFDEAILALFEYCRNKDLLI